MLLKPRPLGSRDSNSGNKIKKTNFQDRTRNGVFLFIFILLKCSTLFQGTQFWIHRAQTKLFEFRLTFLLPRYKLSQGGRL